MIYAFSSTSLSEKIMTACGECGETPQMEVRNEKSFEIGKGQETVTNLNPRICIIDENVITDTENIDDAIRKIRIMAANTRIIYITSPGAAPNDPLYRSLVETGIYDILIHDEIQNDFIKAVHTAIEKPATYGNCARFLHAESGQNKPKMFPSKGKRTVIEKEIHVREYGNAVIGIAGLQPRLGTTHFTIQTAKTLVKLGYSVGVILDAPTFDAIGEVYCETNILDTNSYELAGIAFHKNRSILDLKGIGYRFTVADCGVYRHDNETYKSADCKIIMCGGKEWELPYLDDFLTQQDELLTKITTYVFPFCDNETFENIASSMPGFRVLQWEYSPTIFQSSVTAQKAIEKLLPNTPQNNVPAKKRKGLFHK